MRMLPLTLAVLAGLLSGESRAAADDLLPAAKPIEEVVDSYIDVGLKQDGVMPAPPADDATLIRRLTLDLVGRIPTVPETNSYVASADPAKRTQLVDRLLAAPGFMRHQAAELDAMLMAGTRSSIRDYLTRAIADNRPWDRIFRELVLPDERDASRRGSSEFVKRRLDDLDKLTTEVSALFFGVNISCARCHDHPLVPDWKQDHFYGMKSFFNRTFDSGGFVAERDYGPIKFKTVKGQERLARLMFLTGAVVADPGGKEPSADEMKKEKERFNAARRAKTPPPAPRFSARAQLVELALQPGQRDFLARSLVNRFWNRVFGYGLVMPVDQMHSENPSSHPDLLRWLARDAVEHGYDCKRLLRGLVLSRAYARSSRWEGENVPRPALFAVARVRPLTPLQLAASLRLATTDPAQIPAASKREEFEKRIDAYEGGARGYADLFEQPGDDFQVGVGEALLFSNSERITRDFLADGGDRLIGRMKQLTDLGQRVDLAVHTVLSRPPRDDETRLLIEYLKQRADRPVEGCRQIVWALLTSAEFRFNY
jgi:hypothetical protein